MVRIRSQNEIILSLIDYFRVTQPLLDTKPGTISRDLIIDGPSSQLSRLYDQLNQLSSLQSLSLAIGSDLDNLSQNYGAVRQLGSKSTGPALLTFSDLSTDIPISQGSIITAKNGATFIIMNSLVISAVAVTTYQAVAAQYQSDLSFVGITDPYAVQVLVQATAAGIQGNISKYSLTTAGIAGINNVTNAVPFSGGSAAETDATFKARVLSIFSGANTGTSLGYENAVKQDPSVIDAIVVGPGDPLMTRDGTQVVVNPDGTKTITSYGTGGKVDVYVYGTTLQQTVDSFIYHDLSNTNNPTNPANNFVLGQIAADSGKTVTQKRLDDIANGTLPTQPVNNIISVSGSLSGPNFASQVTDNLGRITGNFNLLKDTGVYEGSPWGFDSLQWISDRISNFGESETKSSFNSQDPINYSDLLEVDSVQQNIVVTNENSQVNKADRTSIQLAHSPITGVTRVFNVTTGERYTISNQNPDGTGSVNTTGRIVISGKSLPAVSDILQVDYTWVFNFDPYFDYDNRLTNNNPRAVQDSIDWGLSNAVRQEQTTLMSSGSYLITTVTHPISSVISVNIFSTFTNNVTILSNRLAVTVNTAVSNVVSIIRESDGADLWNTTKTDGAFNGMTIYLPTDSAAVFGDAVSITFNAVDVFNASTVGSFTSNTITIVPSVAAVAGTLVECNYIANVNTLLPSTLLSTLPAIRAGNGFNTNVTTSPIGTQPTTHIFSGNKIIQNLRQGPSNLSLTIAGSISPGVITVSGTTIQGVFNATYTVSSNSLTQDLTTAIKNFLNLNSITPVPSNIQVARLVKASRVVTDSSLNILSTINNYDIKGYHLLNNNFVKNESIADSAISATQIVLPSTSNNLTNIPNIGDRIQISFYISTTGNSENVSFSKAGTLYTNNRYAFVDTIAISSGFNSIAGSSATLVVNNLNQPTTGSRYKAFYDYLAPKPNERITINYYYEQIITTGTLSVESARPIGADVLVKSAQPILIDITMNISVTSAYMNSPSIVTQNVQDAITAALNASALGTTISQSDLINAAYQVSGLARARVLYFNIDGETGSVLTIQAANNQFLAANTVTINLETI
jgi:hypothetical protein